jgi:hypothetical protein
MTGKEKPRLGGTAVFFWVVVGTFVGCGKNNITQALLLKLIFYNYKFCFNDLTSG